jgi:lambda family phage portal protein
VARNTWLSRTVSTLVRPFWRAPATVNVRAYAGAEFTRLMADFDATMLSADQATEWALRVVRDRARKLERDSALAKAWIRAAVDNIIGPDGFSLRVMAASQPTADAVRSAFYAWCAAEQCDATGRLSFTQLERLAVERWRGADGEVLVRLWRGVGTYGLRLQVLDADLLDETYSRAASAGQPEIRQGVEVDAVGRPVAYHLWAGHPSEARGIRQRVRVPARDIIHLYRQDRPGQTRGMSAFAPVLRELFQLEAMHYAVLTAQRVAAQSMGILRPTDPEVDPLYNAADPKQNIAMEVKPAGVVQIPYGFDFIAWTPGQPGPYYEAFDRNATHRIAAGLGCTHLTLMGDGREANYGSQRGLLQRERRMWRNDQEMLREMLHERVVREWLTEARLAGALPRAAASISWEWLLPTWEWVDPLKDIQAAAMEVALGVQSLTAIAASKGRDFAAVVQQRADELRLAADAGVPLYLPTSVAPATEEPDGTATPAAPLRAIA